MRSLKFLKLDVPVLIIGLFLAAGSLGASLYLQWPTFQAVVLELLIIMIVYLAEILLRVRYLEDENSPWREERVYMESDKEFAEWIKKIVSNHKQAKRFEHKTFQSHLEDEKEYFLSHLQRYARGQMAYEHHREPPFFYRQPEFVEQEIRSRFVATCIVEREEFWTKGIRASYLLGAQKQVIEKNPDAEVLRIFIEHRNRIRYLKAAIKEHQDYGIPVFIAVWEDLRADLREDFMIVDDTLLIQQEFEELHPHERLLKTTRVWLDQNEEGKLEIQKALRQFGDIKRAARKPKHFNL
jgi:hypothetical protein